MNKLRSQVFYFYFSIVHFCLVHYQKKVREKSRESHNHKPQEEETDKSKQAQIEQTYEKH